MHSVNNSCPHLSTTIEEYYEATRQLTRDAVSIGMQVEYGNDNGDFHSEVIEKVIENNMHTMERLSRYFSVFGNFIINVNNMHWVACRNIIGENTIIIDPIHGAYIVRPSEWLQYATNNKEKIFKLVKTPIIISPSDPIPVNPRASPNDKSSTPPA